MPFALDELGNDEEDGLLFPCPDFPADSLRLSRRYRAVGLQVDADPRHVAHPCRGEQTQPQRCGPVLFVHRHQVIGPAPGQLFQGAEGGILQRRPTLVEMEAVRGVDQRWPPSPVAQSHAGDEGGDWGMDVDQVVIPVFHQLAQSLGCGKEVLQLQRVARPIDLEGMIEDFPAFGTAGGPLRQSVDTPAASAKMADEWEQEGAQGEMGRGYEQDSGLFHCVALFSRQRQLSK